MKCGHLVYDYEMQKQDGIVFLRWICKERHKTEWGCVGEEPSPEDLNLEEGT